MSILNPIFSNLCSDQQENVCEIKEGDNNLVLQNVSKIPGPSMWVPTYTNDNLPPSCITVKSNATCVNYPKNKPITQQTFTLTNATTWIQDYPSKPMNIIANPGPQKLNLANPLISKYQTQSYKNQAICYNNNNDDSSECVNISKMDTQIKQEIINISTVLAQDTTSVAPECIITTPNCSKDNKIDACQISCILPKENIPYLYYKYNKQYEIWDVDTSSQVEYTTRSLEKQKAVVGSALYYGDIQAAPENRNEQTDVDGSQQSENIAHKEWVNAGSNNLLDNLTNDINVYLKLTLPTSSTLD